MAEVKEPNKTNQTEAEPANNTAQQKQEEVLAKLLETAKPDVSQHKRQMLAGLLLPAVLLIIGLVFARILWGEWQPTFELGAVALTTYGTVVIVLGALPSPKTAALMSTTRWDGNRYLLAELLKNRLAAWSGLILILLGFLFQSAVFALQQLSIK